MKFLRNWFEARNHVAAAREPVTGEQFRKNVKENCIRCLNFKKKGLADSIHVQPPKHAGDLFFTLQKLSEYTFELGMLDWRDGIDPSRHLAEMQRSWALALDVRPDILPGNQNPGFMAIVSDMMGWDIPFNTDPPGEDVLKYAMIWMDRWIIAGLSDPSCWPMRANAPATKIQFIDKCLDDYWALLTDQIDPEEGIRRCIKDYNRRATHQTFKVLPSYMGGGAYNALFVDYTLAAILKKRGLSSGSIHDWVWG